VSEVVVDAQSEVASHRSRGRIQRIGRAHHGPNRLDRILAANRQGHNWTRGEVVANAAKERSFLVLRIVSLNGFARCIHKLQPDNFKVASLNSGSDFTDEISLNAARLNENQSCFHEPRSVPTCLMAHEKAPGVLSYARLVTVARISNLTVRYGNFTALDDLSCEIPEGCTGLLGPNGAGKTTLLKTILGFVNPTSGEGTVMDKNIRTDGMAIRQLIGLMPEQDCHIPGMTAVGFVSYAGELSGMPPADALRRAHEVLEYCGLGEARYRNVETYSTGMKQRIKLAQALVHGPKLLLLDEPTNGLDPRGREEMLDLVRSVSHGRGVNVIVSSHLLPDIERVCDRVIVVIKGKLRTAGTIKDLKKLAGQPADVELREPNLAFANLLMEKGLTVAPPKGNVYRVQSELPPEDLLRVVQRTAVESGAQVRGFETAVRTLEEVFLEALTA